MRDQDTTFAMNTSFTKTLPIEKYLKCHGLRETCKGTVELQQSHLLFSSRF